MNTQCIYTFYDTVNTNYVPKQLTSLYSGHRQCSMTGRNLISTYNFDKHQSSKVYNRTMS